MEDEVIVKSKPNWIVKDVDARDDYTLIVTFVTGEKKSYDCTPLLTTGVFRELRDPEVFKMAHVDVDTVAWNDTIDIAPETLYSDGVAL